MIYRLSILEVLDEQESKKTAIANIPQSHHGNYDWDANGYSLLYSYYTFFEIDDAIAEEYATWQILEYFDDAIAEIVGEGVEIRTFKKVGFVPQNAIVHPLN